MGVATFDVDSDIAADRRSVIAADLRDRVAALNSELPVEAHFAAATFPIVEELHSLIDDLCEHPSEGAAVEILRRLRDTFLDGGWEQYRRPEARQAAVAVLEGLVSEASLDGKSIVAATEILRKAGVLDGPAWGVRMFGGDGGSPKDALPR